MNISAVVIVKNEEASLRRCLESLRWVSEIVIVDSGSTDNTLTIAREFTDRIFVNLNWRGFGLQKRFAEDQAQHDWVISLDADEVVTPKLRDEIIGAMASVDESTVMQVNRLTRFCGRFVRHSGWHPDRIVRIYNRRRFRMNEREVHESVDCRGATVVRLREPLLHCPVGELWQFIAKQHAYAGTWAQQNRSKGRKVLTIELLVRPIFAFFKAYILQMGFLDGWVGFLISAIRAQYVLTKYAMLVSEQSVCRGLTGIDEGEREDDGGG